jgi:DNA-binding MarR family transcriptional regulator
MTRTRPTLASDDVAAEFGPALHFLRALWELNHSLESASRTMKRRLGVTGPERLFIRVVGQRPGITPAAIAEILRVDRSSVTPLLKRLEQRRLVRRERDLLDGRSVHLSLTASGSRIDSMDSGTIEAAVSQIIAASPQREVEMTAATLVRVARQLSAKTARAIRRLPAR